jgi:hypothetical protein
MCAGERVSGKCLCGATTFVASLADGAMHACHCAACRRWTGGMLLYLPVEPGSFSSAGSTEVFKSSSWAERGFCAVCGSSLFWRMQDGSSVDVSAQAVDDPGRFPFASEIFVEEKPANYDFANATVKRTGAEVMAEHHGIGASGG